MTVDLDIINGLKCPYCNSKTEFINSQEIYGKDYGNIYICRSCSAYVGVHKETNKALGRLANKELRELKKVAHFHFDKIAKTSLINEIWPEYIENTSNRQKAYLWLSKQMNIEPEYCHIGMFDEHQCLKAISICSKIIYEKTLKHE